MKETARAFDDAAAGYDSDFTFSAVGMEQRKRVWHYFDRYLPKEPINILELNCGTGEDAFYLNQKGYFITATDISEKMIETANRKKEKLSGLPDFSIMDMQNIRTEKTGKKFNAIVSNFGGINCLKPEDIKELALSISVRLNKGEQCILVVMGTGCYWEKIYYFFKKGFRVAANKRKHSPVEVPVENRMVKTWFYKPSELRSLFHQNFNQTHCHPIGLFIPPSYLNNWFSKRKMLLNVLVKMEQLFSFAGFLSNSADHYLIVLERK